MRENVIKQIEQEKIIAIIRGVSKEKLLPLANALYQGGIRLVECTFDASGKVSNEETASYINLLSKNFEGKMFVGAGTVLSEEQVLLTKNAGGKFIISPDTNANVIKRTREENLVSIPGAFTPTEIVTATSYGADFVKIFPAVSVGSKYIKAVLAPLSNVKVLAVGGVNADNLDEFFSVGIYGIGVGSEIILKDALKRNAYEEITALAKKYVKKIKKWTEK